MFVVSNCDVLLEECMFCTKQAKATIEFAHSMPSFPVSITV
jgi:hypothetical protein